ncbi:MAG TPA: phosphoribosylamine--glycine ligase [archaeon]|nr:phosphoribosylamine--glycine ligase [archaeon]
MKILIIGSGGREHALAWKISKSPKVKSIFCAPGNAGTLEFGKNIPIDQENISRLLEFAKKEKIDLTVVGPEAPLVEGIVDEFEKAGLKIFGPRANAAIIEGSKSFAKEIMEKANVPTAAYKVITGIDEAQMDLDEFDKAAVKADGLAAGKGVFICNSKSEIMGAVNKLLQEKLFGGASSRIVVEELLDGEEASILAFCDGKNVKMMVSAQDHKRIFDNDKGSNTGGMGAYSPAPIVNGLEERIKKEVMQPVVDQMRKRETPYKGILYAGLMVKNGNFKVLEFNARFGDPECQCIIPRLENDLVDVMEACISGTLDKIDLKWKKDPACCVVIASGGYPEKYAKGIEIFGLKNASAVENVIVFHAGTKFENGKVVTNGGRVLGVVGIGKNIKDAIDTAYKGVAKINFEKMHFRKDIGKRALGREK